MWLHTEDARESCDDEKPQGLFESCKSQLKVTVQSQGLWNYQPGIENIDDMLPHCQVLPLNTINLGALPLIPLTPSLRWSAQRPLKVWILTAAIFHRRRKAKEKAVTPLRRNFPLINLWDFINFYGVISSSSGFLRGGEAIWRFLIQSFQAILLFLVTTIINLKHFLLIWKGDIFCL